MTQMMIKSPSGGSEPYVTTAKFMDTYFPAYNDYNRSDMWPADNGSLFTFAAFMKMGDQPTSLSNRIFLTSLWNYFTFMWKNWDNYIDLGSGTNRFSIYTKNESGDGKAEITYGNETHGLNPDDWFAFMYSIDYSGATPVVECWVQKKGESTAYSISGAIDLGEDTGPITFAWDDTTVLTAVGHHASYQGDQGEYDISEIFITNEAVDWSDPAVRAKFVNSVGKPVGCGTNGSDLTGTQPKHYAPDGDLSNNVGTESNWTANGTIVDSATSPSD